MNETDKEYLDCFLMREGIVSEVIMETKDLVTRWTGLDIYERSGDFNSLNMDYQKARSALCSDIEEFKSKYDGGK